MDYLQTKGRIFDIQRYSIHDGTGIRTIVFLKGCPLRCKWCCNPESQIPEIQEMKVLGVPKTIGEDITVADVMRVVERDRAYYRRSSGGMTLSGGESLFQPEFARDLLRASKSIGINTAMESTGFASYAVIEQVLPYLDQYLMDIKHIDSSKHREFTGQPNELILENAKKIAQSNQTKLIIRVPVVPTVNDSEASILDIATFAQSLPGVDKIHLLPYHRLGEDKYDGLGRRYLLSEIRPPEPEQMIKLKAAVEQKTSLSCQIGG